MRIVSRELVIEHISEKPEYWEKSTSRQWHPSVIIWPRYSGLDMSEYDMTFGDDDRLFDEWGGIIATTLETFANELHLNVLQFRKRKKRLISDRLWEIADAVISRDDIMLRSGWGVDISLFLLSEIGVKDIPPAMATAEAVNMEELLQLGVGIFQFGYETPSIELSLGNYIEVFFRKLNQVAMAYNYKMAATTAPLNYAPSSIFL